MKRTLIKDSPQKVGTEITVAGWIQTVRKHGKIAFFDVYDRSGLLQVVATAPEVLETVNKLEQRAAVRVTGTLKQRGEKYINPDLLTGTVEMESSEVEIISLPDTLPFDMGGKELKLELPTLLDYRSLTLKHETQRDIFIIQAAIAEEFRNAAKALDCIEIFVPTIVAGATEGGAEVFSVDYFDRKAYMSQSPQLYKQMMVGVFERVFTIAKAYRAEPSVTTRHLTEATQMDVEIAFIESFDELLDALEFVGTTVIAKVAERYPKILEAFGVEKPLTSNVPRLTLREAQEIVTKRTGRDLSKEKDLNPEDEKEICLWAKEEKQSDFVTITHFPMEKKPFYTHPDPESTEYSLSYDLLFRGLEVLSGSRRVDNYDLLVKQMKDKKVDPDSFRMYLMAFKYGMPPEGGFSFGLERLTMKLLELSNVREASLFPRDMERIDERFSKIADNTSDKK
ncbi:MAG TPA: aspartate--tRNA(Asn) ligase [Candidatus Eisenbacteria bacterium]|nr:aspartate--tRNA(Asn) ligase [Candidatus Eisenbacteria bacterium]